MLHSITLMNTMNFEDGVSLIQLSDATYCLNNAYRQSQVFGDLKLKEYYENICNNMPVNSNVYDTLLQYNFLTDQKPEAYKQKLLRDSTNYSIDPKFNLLRILLTDVCNLNCDYCKVIKLIDTPSAKPIKTKRLEEAIRFFFENSNEAEPKIIHITGGEPTLFFDSIKQIIQFKKNYSRPNENCWIVMGTNAISITPEKAKFLADNNVKCIVSMDGPEEIHNVLRKNHAGHGTWATVNKNIKLLQSYGVEISISAVMGKHTIYEADKNISFIINEYNPTGLGINFMKPPTTKSGNYEYLIDEQLYAETMYMLHKKYRSQGVFFELIFRHLEPFVKQTFRFHDCGAAASKNLNIDAKGNIGPCKSFLLLNRMSMQNINIHEYSNIVSANWEKRSPIYFAPCQNCPSIGICGNGCAYDAFINNKDMLAVDTRGCKYVKYFYKLFLEDLYNISKQTHKDQNIFVPTQSDRQKMLGNVKEIQNSLSYSIGHQTKQFHK